MSLSAGIVPEIAKHGGCTVLTEQHVRRNRGGTAMQGGLERGGVAGRIAILTVLHFGCLPVHRGSGDDGGRELHDAATVDSGLFADSGLGGDDAGVDGGLSADAAIDAGSFDAGTDGGADGSITATVIGTVTGIGLVTADAVSLDASQVNGGAPTAGGVIIISSKPSLCAEFASGAQPPGDTTLLLEVCTVDILGNTQSPTPGTYVIGANPPGNVAVAQFEADDSSCRSLSGRGGQATGGNVMVTAMNLAAGGGIVGTFDLSFGTDHTTGMFDAPFCGSTLPANPICQ